MFLRSGDSTARLWRLGDGVSHDSPVVLPHEPVGSTSQECNRDVTTVHWNVSSKCYLCNSTGWVCSKVKERECQRPLMTKPSGLDQFFCFVLFFAKRMMFRQFSRFCVGF